jgi:arginine/lysine/ornithine decarboxylase
LSRKVSQISIPSVVKGMFHSRTGVGHSARKNYSKEQLQTMIQNSEQRIDSLHKASPLITNAEAILGSLKALC